MKNYGFFRCAAAIPSVTPGNPESNVDNILNLAREAERKGAGLVVFPELCVTGYTCADLFNQTLLLEAAATQTKRIEEWCADHHIAVVVGLPAIWRNRLYNCAVFISGEGIRGIVPKSYLPNYNEFYEKRWFASGRDIRNASVSLPGYPEKEYPFGTDLIFDYEGVKVALEICEDVWVPVPPSTAACQAGADIVCNLSATDEVLGKHRYLLQLLASHSAACRCGYVYSSAGWGESSTDLAFSGNAIIAEDGTIIAESERFCLQPQVAVADIDIERLRNDRRRFSTYGELPAEEEKRLDYIFIPSSPLSGNGDCQSDPENDTHSADLLREIDPHPFVPSDPRHLKENCTEIISIQSWGLAKRIEAIGGAKIVVGISGGLDSTLALLVAARTLDMLGRPKKDIIGITMPGFGTTTRTHSNANDLMEQLGVTSMEISIDKAVRQHFSDIGQDEKVHDATYENSQARERTQILMDMANKVGGIVLGTGDLSELALGWCTYNGDQMSMYGVNTSVPKTLVKYLVEWFASEAEEKGEHKTAGILRDIIDTPISPELVPAAEGADRIEQKTEDLVGPYELHDFFLYHAIRNSFTPQKIEYLANKAFRGKYDSVTIHKWLDNFYRRFFSQQFKRSCMPDGVKVGSVCLSPRGDWRMPSDASSALWRK